MAPGTPPSMAQHHRHLPTAVDSISSPSSPAPNTALCSAVNDNDKIDSRALIMNVSLGDELSLSPRERPASWLRRVPLRDLALLLCGTVVGALALSFGSRLQPHDGSANVANPGSFGPRAQAANFSSRGFLVPERSDRFTLPLAMERARHRRYAYVLMAHDEPGKPLDYIWRAVAMARALQRLSDYPTLLLTNATRFPDGTPVAEAFEKLGVRVLPLHVVPVPAAIEQSLTPEFRVAYWKVQIWRFTEYEKLIWLDADAVVTRSLDHLFELEPPWAQRDVWVCSKSKEGGFQDWPSSGLVLVKPSEETYQGLVSYAGTTQVKWWVEGDRQLLQSYFQEVAKPIQLLGLGEAAFGKCLGVVPNLFNETPGEIWNMPAYVHKSSLKNECFYFQIADQLRKVEGRTVNICHYHPLGPYWRELFCQGLQLMGVKTSATEAYCDDFLWQRHR